ncbi:helix-turn-helix domain-containing protein [Enterovirga sp. CN4-39]|uniref:helix-turn-helix domain-containing protein n=1 Tax=Enterovirga sp. CN4-39 TaxID=3400910 RepID=UPI003BFE50C3
MLGLSDGPTVNPASPAPLSQDFDEVGLRMRLLRQAQGLPLQKLSAETGLSIGLLSQIERGISSPTVRHLRLISDCLGVGPSFFFGVVDENKCQELGNIIVRAAGRRIIQFAEGIRKELLTPDDPDGIELLLVTMEAGASSGEEFYVHPGEEAGTVLTGSMRLFVRTETLILAAGDSFRFKSTIPHRFENAGQEQTRVLWALRAPVYV